MRPFLAIAALLPLLAGCGGDPGDFEASNASVADVAAKAQEAQKQQPGKWETTTRIVSLENADVPKDSPVAKLMQEQLGKEQTRSACITPEQAEKPIFAQATDPTGKCRYDHISMKNGHLDALLECPAPDGPGTVQVKHTGTFTPTSYSVESSMTRMDASGAKTGAMTMKITAKRTGDCKA